MAEASDLDRLRERKQILVELADAQRTLVALEWDRLKAFGSKLNLLRSWPAKVVPLVGVAAAGLGFLGASRLGLASRLMSRGLAAWQVYRRARGFWNLFAKPSPSNRGALPGDRSSGGR